MTNLVYVGDDFLADVAESFLRLGLEHGRTRARMLAKPDGAYAVQAAVLAREVHVRPYHRRELHKVYLAGFSIGHHNEVTVAREGAHVHA